MTTGGTLLRHYSIKDGSARLTLQQGDITKLTVDAIVNAANKQLLGGGGVDGAIHRAAGPGLLEACRQLPEIRPGVRCPVGEARLTEGFDLPARYVIHAVGPIYNGPKSAKRLRDAYRNSLALAQQQRLGSIAFPAISCGVYGYPLSDAAQVAFETCQEFVTPEQVIFVLFDRKAYDAFSAVADGLFSQGVEPA